MRITPLDYATRAHEILEDAQRDMLSDAVAPWSGAGVHATAASLDATEVVIGTLRPLLAGRGALPPVETGLLGLRRELDAVRRAHGGRLPATRALGRREREALSGSLGAALERLAAVPGALETRLPAAIPRSLGAVESPERAVRESLGAVESPERAVRESLGAVESSGPIR